MPGAGRAGAILSTREVVGVHGVYNFRPGNLHGVDERARVIVELLP